MINRKKFIAPGAWFAMTYPADWHEFEGGEESFLFYNPNDWDGNFRISAFRGERANYGQEVVNDELKRSKRAQAVMVGDLPCAYSCEVFTEDGEAYENHQWVTGIGDVAFEVSFATAQGASIRKAQEVIASLELRYPGVKYHAELIPIREWMTLIDGSREVPVLVNMADDKTIDPMKLVWSKVKNGESVNLTNTYEQIL